MSVTSAVVGIIWQSAMTRNRRGSPAMTTTTTSADDLANIPHPAGLGVCR